MSGIRKSHSINSLSRLYEQKGIDYKRKELEELSNAQLQKKIKELKTTG